MARFAPRAPALGAPRAPCPILSDAGLPEGARLLGTVAQPPEALALSPDTVYWTTGFYVGPTRGDVMSEALDGGPPTPVAITQGSPGPIVLDSNTLYWANAGNVGGGWAPSTGSVVSLALDGGTPITLASGQDDPVAIAVDATNVYYFTGGTVGGDGGASPVNLLSVPRAATAPTTPTTVLSGLVATGPLAVSAGTIAFATSTQVTGGGDGGFLLTFASQIATVPITGGTVTPLATSDRAVRAIALDTTNVYWLDSSTNSLPNDMAAADGRVRSVPRSAGAPSTLADSQPGPAQLVLLGSTLFWSNGGVPASNGSATNNAGLWSVPAAGGTPSGLVTNQWGFGPFAIDATHIAWVGTFDPSASVQSLFVKDR